MLSLQICTRKLLLNWDNRSNGSGPCNKTSLDKCPLSSEVKKCYDSTVWELHCLRTALCESIRNRAKSEQNVRQDLIPRVRHGESALSTPRNVAKVTKVLHAINSGNLRAAKILVDQQVSNGVIRFLYTYPWCHWHFYLQIIRTLYNRVQEFIYIFSLGSMQVNGDMIWAYSGVCPSLSNVDYLWNNQTNGFTFCSSQ